MIKHTIEIVDRIFKYRGKNYEFNDMHEYEYRFVPCGRKLEKSALLLIDSKGNPDTITTWFDYGKPKDRMNFKCKAPDGTKFDYGGSFVTFEQLFGIKKDDIKYSSLKRHPLDNGWQFWKSDGVIFI